MKADEKRPPDSWMKNDFFSSLRSRRDDVFRRFMAATPKSGEAFKRATSVYPGGFTRDALLRKPYVPFFKGGSGAVLTDEDGREVVDFWFNATSLPVGHAHPDVQAAIAKQAKLGTAFFGTTGAELEWGEEILRRIPSGERLRVANSGSEAVMLAIRLARAHTGRSLIGKFEGSYHGSYDDVSWSVGPSREAAGPAASPNAAAESLGLVSAAGRSLVLPFNDSVATKALVEAHAADLACMIVEPVANRMGLVVAEEPFLTELRRLCDEYGIVLIFDEVISFRVGFNGAQGFSRTKPDLTTLGKVIGGGLPVGAVVGKAAVMQWSDPWRSPRVTHAGTFNGNPLTARAGLATLNVLTEVEFGRLAARGESLRTKLREALSGLPLQVKGTGSLFKIAATPTEIRDHRTSLTEDRDWAAIASLELLTRGFLLTPSLQGCISTETTDAQIENLLEAVNAVVRM